jgi:4-amino-4-deoxy-L-arabinose transferase-like glycosyltransferase
LIADLLGLLGIGVVASLTLLIAVRWPSAGRILWVALVARVTLLLLGYYLITLPDSGADAMTFESRAWEWSQGGFFEALAQFTGPSSYFISWILSVLYSVTGRSLLIAQSVSLLFGMGTVWMGWLLAKALWGERVAGKAGWVLALFPTLILYSALTMREAYVQFFILLALNGVVSWCRCGHAKPMLLAIFGVVAATFFHGAMVVGLLTFLLVVSVSAGYRLVKALLRSRVHALSAVLVLVAGLGLGFFVSNMVSLPKIGNFESATDLGRIVDRIEVSTRDGAAYPQWTVPNDPVDLLYKSPVRVLYFLFSPFPWDVQKSRHMIGLLDGLVYIALVALIWRNRKEIWSDRASRTVMLIVLSYIFVFGVAIGNFGTGARHRTKIVGGLIVLSAPKLKKLSMSKILLTRVEPIVQRRQ